jgi:hypothetical protein
VTAPRPRHRALTRHGQRRLLRQRAARQSRPRRGALTRHGQRRLFGRAMADARLATPQATSQTRAGRVARRASPLGPAGLFACPSHQARGQRDSTNQM